MGQFFEPEEIIKDGIGTIASGKPKIFTKEFISNIVKKSIENGDIPTDHKLAFVGAVDENGVRAIISVEILDKPILDNNVLNIKFQSIVEHEWTGDNKAGAQILFSVR